MYDPLSLSGSGKFPMGMCMNLYLAYYIISLLPKFNSKEPGVHISLYCLFPATITEDSCGVINSPLQILHSSAFAVVLRYRYCYNYDY
jgi:hypothetical protein